MLKNCSTNESQQASCSSRVIDPTTLGECTSQCSYPYGQPGPVVVKVPVVLADCKIQIDLESDIRLNEPAFDIKTIDKKVCITQCHLVPHTNKLFLAGFVQKNIQFSTVECANATSISGDILHTTVNVPFRCVSPIKFVKKPKFGKSFKSRSNVLDETMVCQDAGEDSWIHFTKLQEPIFCELEWTKILESDIFDRNINCAAPFTTEECFQEFTEKMVVFIKIKVLQNQQVYIPEPNCKVEMIKEDDSDEDYDYDYEDVEVGYDPEKGVHGRIIKEENY